MMGRFLVGFVLAAVFSVGFLAIPGCNTVEGAGQDIEAAGEGIEDAAD
jgi:predicted small secreted protein